MQIFKDPKRIQRFMLEQKRNGKTIAFVPTMGALHDGHAALLRRGRCAADILVLSIFVNPLQFGPREDFSKYPRTLKADLAVARKEKVDIVFTPRADDLYAADFSAQVLEGALSEGLCGASRPGHFKGVATVVAKLFNIVQPDSAFFGQKDYQQFKVIERMVRDLDFPVRLVMVPTVREEDGLAMSSRNWYLSAEERTRAAALSWSLKEARKDLQAGGKPKVVEKRIIRTLQACGIKKIDYVRVLSAVDLKEPENSERRLVIAAAVYAGKTRLIDNVLVNR